MEDFTWKDLPRLFKVYIITMCFILAVAVMNLISQTILFLTVAKWVGTL